MSEFTRIRDIILNEFETNGKSSVLLFPYGETGVLTNDILIKCFDCHPIIFDNSLCKFNPKVRSLDNLEYSKDLLKNSVLFLCTNNQAACEELRNIINGKIRIVDLSPPIPQAAMNKYTNRLNIGDYSYGPLTEANNRIEKIGKFCSFANGSTAVWNHQLGMVTNHDFIYELKICQIIDNQKIDYKSLNKKFIIGNDVWIGTNAVLLNGIKVGNGAIIGAGSIVTKDVPDYAVVVGNPARIIKYRFTDEQIRMLNEISWWDWPIEKIKECYDDFFDIDLFLKKHYNSKSN